MGFYGFHLQNPLGNTLELILGRLVHIKGDKGGVFLILAKGGAAPTIWNIGNKRGLTPKTFLCTGLLLVISFENPADFLQELFQKFIRRFHFVFPVVS